MNATRRNEHSMTRDPGSEFQALIYPHTGSVTEILLTDRGCSSDLTAVITCEKGPFFVKAMRNRPGGRRDSIIREKLINPFVQPISPAMRWEAEDEEWIALGFDLIDGRQSNFRPNSPDLPAVVGILNRIGELDLPEVAQSWPETRWDWYVTDEAEAELFRGDALLHADINPSNLLIGDGRVWVLDWGWPTRGAAFIDPAMLVVQLVAAGHTAVTAESWAARCKAWVTADPRAIDIFAAAAVRMWAERADSSPDEPCCRAMSAAAEAWAAHRGIE